MLLPTSSSPCSSQLSAVSKMITHPPPPHPPKPEEKQILFVHYKWTTTIPVRPPCAEGQLRCKFWQGQSTLWCCLGLWSCCKAKVPQVSELLLGVEKNRICNFYLSDSMSDCLRYTEHVAEDVKATKEWETTMTSDLCVTLTFIQDGSSVRKFQCLRFSSFKVLSGSRSNLTGRWVLWIKWLPLPLHPFPSDLSHLTKVTCDLVISMKTDNLHNCFVGTWHDSSWWIVQYDSSGAACLVWQLLWLSGYLRPWGQETLGSILVFAG